MTARILIVEDEEPLTLLLRYNLEAEAYAVDTAARGPDAEVRLQEVTPGQTECRLLEFLMQSRGRVFSREQLLDGVWGRHVYIDERTVDVHVGRLRRALNRGRASDPIRTVRGTGYSFDERFGKDER